MKKIIIFIFLLFFISQMNSEEKTSLFELYLNSVLNGQRHNALDSDSIILITDKTTAISIAEIYARSVYGDNTVDNEIPLIAELCNGYWIVTGTPLPEEYVGGIVEIVINQKNGEVINISHGE